MRFKESYFGWQEKRLTQAEAALLLGVHERTFRRYIDRYEEAGMEGLLDKRLSQVSSRRAPVDEVLALEALYRERYDGWNVRHFHRFYRCEHGGQRSYSWVKSRLQASRLVAKGFQAGRSPQTPAAGALAGDDAAPGREHPLLGAARTVGSDRDHG